MAGNTGKVVDLDFTNDWCVTDLDIKTFQVSEANAHLAAQEFNPGPDNQDQAMSKESFRFYFVRDPFDRLVSCYIDKFLNNNHNN